MRVLKVLSTALLAIITPLFMYFCFTFLMAIRQLFQPSVNLGARGSEAIILSPPAYHLDFAAWISYILGFIMFGLLFFQETRFRRAISPHLSTMRITIAVIACVMNGWCFPELGLGRLWACTLLASGWFILTVIEITQIRFRAWFARPSAADYRSQRV